MKKALSTVSIGILTTGFIGFSELKAKAASINFSPTISTGDLIGIDITLDDSITSGKVRATVNVTNGIGDLSGVYFNIADDSLLGGLTFTPISSLGAAGRPANFISLIDQDGSANNLGKGVNMNGGSGPSTFEVGLRIGNSGGINGGDDFQQIVFDIGHNSSALNLSAFINQNFGVRVKSVGASREGSTKLTGVAPTPTPSVQSVPEPSTIFGVALIGGTLNVLRRRKSE